MNPDNEQWKYAASFVFQMSIITILGVIFSPWIIKEWLKR